MPGKRPRNRNDKPRSFEQRQPETTPGPAGDTNFAADDVNHNENKDTSATFSGSGDSGGNVNFGRDSEQDRNKSLSPDETSSASDATAASKSQEDGSEDEEEEEVVISASLNLGQNQQVQLKTRVEPTAKANETASPKKLDDSIYTFPEPPIIKLTPSSPITEVSPRKSTPAQSPNKSANSSDIQEELEISSMERNVSMQSDSSTLGNDGDDQGADDQSPRSTPSDRSYTTANNSSEENAPNSLNSTRSAPPDLSFSVIEPEPTIVETAMESTPETTAVAKPQEPTLPVTVSTLTLRSATIYLIGTAHFSVQSQEDVRTVIRMTQPDCIMLELCPSRRNILHLDEEMLLKEAGDISFAKISATLRAPPSPGSSKVQSLLHLLLLSMSASLTKKLGMAPGGEFRAAVKEAENMQKKPSILLGDRPFNVTLSRAIYSLSLWQKVKLAWQFLISSDDITKEEIEKCKERDLLEQMLSEMTGEFPSITEVFVNERDIYLAHTLYLSTMAVSDNIASPVVVAVVGMGHVPGICKHFGNTSEEEFERVASLPPTGPPSTVLWLVKNTVKLTFYGCITYGAYKLFNRVDFFKRLDFKNGLKLGVVKINK